jgi:hypothetical protein
MKLKLKVAITLMIIPAVVFSVSCDSPEKKESSRTKPFAAIDSLLGEVYQIPNTDKSFRPPVGFEAAADTVLEMLRAQLARNLGDQTGVEMVQCFLDTIHTAGLTVSTIEGINLGVDTTGFIERYRQKLYDIFGQENIRQNDYWVNNILVKSFFVSDAIIVRAQLLCLSETGNAVELTYFTPREQYQELVKLFESSMGSIEPAQ